MTLPIDKKYPTPSIDWPEWVKKLELCEHGTLVKLCKQHKCVYLSALIEKA